MAAAHQQRLHRQQPDTVHFFLNYETEDILLLDSFPKSCVSRPSVKTISAPSSTAFECECVGFFAEIVQVFGVPRSVGQIYGLLYASPVPLSFSDIFERLDMSKGSASQGLQLLRSLGAINIAAPFECTSRGEDITRVGGSQAKRNVTYEPELSLRRLVSGVLHERIAPLTAANTDRLASLRKLALLDEEQNDFYLDRIKQLENWRRQLKSLLPMLSMLLGPKGKK